MTPSLHICLDWFSNFGWKVKKARRNFNTWKIAGTNPHWKRRWLAGKSPFLNRRYLGCPPPPSNSGKWRFIGVPDQRYNLPGGDRYCAGDNPRPIFIPGCFCSLSFVGFPGEYTVYIDWGRFEKSPNVCRWPGTTKIATATATFAAVRSDRPGVGHEAIGEVSTDLTPKGSWGREMGPPYFREIYRWVKYS